MALPMERTPVLEGEAAEELLVEVRTACSDEEAARRIAAARVLLQEVGLPPMHLCRRKTQSPPSKARLHGIPLAGGTPRRSREASGMRWAEAHATR